MQQLQQAVAACHAVIAGWSELKHSPPLVEVEQLRDVISRLVVPAFDSLAADPEKGFRGVPLDLGQDAAEQDLFACRLKQAQPRMVARALHAFLGAKPASLGQTSGVAKSADFAVLLYLAEMLILMEQRVGVALRMRMHVASPPPSLTLFKLVSERHVGKELLQQACALLSNAVGKLQVQHPPAPPPTAAAKGGDAAARSGVGLGSSEGREALPPDQSKLDGSGSSRTGSNRKDGSSKVGSSSTDGRSLQEKKGMRNSSSSSSGKDQEKGKAGSSSSRGEVGGCKEPLSAKDRQQQHVALNKAYADVDLFMDLIRGPMYSIERMLKCQQHFVNFGVSCRCR